MPPLPSPPNPPPPICTSTLKNWARLVLLWVGPEGGGGRAPQVSGGAGRPGAWGGGGPPPRPPKYHPKGPEAAVFFEVSIDPKGLQSPNPKSLGGFGLCPDPNRNGGARRPGLKRQRRRAASTPAMAHTRRIRIAPAHARCTCTRCLIFSSYVLCFPSRASGFLSNAPHQAALLMRCHLCKF